jgi:protein-L-isoaspartate(D-aspartate) O-methyltransferase
MGYSNIEQARFNMVEQQIRPAEVLDTRVLSVIEDTPREEYVPIKYRQLAFSDTNIPLGHGQTMMSPIMEARALQALDIKDNNKILEIGTGSGYLTALLTKLGNQVISVEINEELYNTAQKTLNAQIITNVSLYLGDASAGWAEQAPYDVIAVTGSMPILSESIIQQLSLGGRALVVVGTEPAMSVLLITRINEQQWHRENLFETVLPPLLNVEKPSTFVF